MVSIGVPPTLPDMRKNPREDGLSLKSMAVGGPGLLAVGELDDFAR